MKTKARKPKISREELSGKRRAASLKRFGGAPRPKRARISVTAEAYARLQGDCRRAGVFITDEASRRITAAADGWQAGQAPKGAPVKKQKPVKRGVTPGELSEIRRRAASVRWGEGRPASRTVYVTEAALGLFKEDCRRKGIKDMTAEASRRLAAPPPPLPPSQATIQP